MTSRNPMGRRPKYQPGEPRACDGCGQVYPYTDAHFFKDGGRLRNVCIACGRARHNARAERHRAKGRVNEPIIRQPKAPKPQIARKPPVVRAKPKPKADVGASLKRVRQRRLLRQIDADWPRFRLARHGTGADAIDAVLAIAQRMSERQEDAA